MKWIFFCLLNVVAAGWAWSAEPVSVDVFTAGMEGYHTFRIPAVVAGPAGQILAFAEARRGGQSDHGDIDLVLRRSLDGGATWGPLQVVWDDAANTCGNPAPVLDAATGRLWLLLTWNRGEDSETQLIAGTSRDIRRVFVLHSDDAGENWSEPKDITASVRPDDWRWYATGPVAGIQLSRSEQKGRLVIPANHSIQGDRRNKQVYRSHVIYSDDHGAAWKVGGLHGFLTNESTVVELADGAILQNMRSNAGKSRRAVSISRDAGLTWSEDQPDPALIEPVCQGALLRYSWPEEGASRILFVNPADEKQRKNLLLRLSEDEGATWPRQCVIEPGSSAYSGLVKLTDGRIGVLFERDGYKAIRFSTVGLEDLKPVQN